MKLLKSGSSFRKEFRRQLRFAITAAIGFSVAFAWRNAIYNSSQDFVAKFSSSTSLVLNELLSAALITFLGVIVILITSRIFKEK